MVLGVCQLTAGSRASAGEWEFMGMYQERFPEETEEIWEIFPMAQVRSLF